MDPLFERVQFLSEICFSEGMDHILFIVFSDLAKKDILGDRRGVDIEILEHGADLLSVFVRVVLADVVTAVPDASVCHVIKTHEKFHEGRLAGTVFTYDRDLLSGMDLDRDIFQCIFIRIRIAEGYVRENQRIGSFCGNETIRHFDVRFFFHQADKLIAVLADHLEIHQTVVDLI